MKNDAKCVGINFGTTICCVQYYDILKQEERVFDFGDGRTTIASNVQFNNNSVIVGEPFVDGITCITEIEQLMGLNFYDEKDEINADGDQHGAINEDDGGGIQILPKEVAAIILKYIKNELSKKLGDNIKATTTVPAYFDDAQRKATEYAGKAAGFDVVNILNEPTAAALAYGFDENNTKILVFDVSGKALDITIGDFNGKKLEIDKNSGYTPYGEIGINTDINRNTANLILEK
ncbi:Molecular chaperone DnaK [Entamoeba marina]